MTLSELCIRRPVMTTLITASIIAFGVFGFRLLPVSFSASQGRFPHHRRDRNLAGRQRGHPWRHPSAGIIERQLSDDRGHLVDVVEFVAGHDAYHHSIRSQPQYRRLPHSTCKPP